MRSLIYVLFVAITTMLLVATSAFAQSDVAVKITAQKKVVEYVDGKPVTKLVDAKNVIPGDTIVYTIKATNNGNSQVGNIVLVDPLPEGVVYLPGTATGREQLSLSTDNGATYTPAEEFGDGTTPRKASVETSPTHLRWIVDLLPAGESVAFEFQARVK